MITLPDGGIALCGRTRSFSSNYDAFLIRTDSTGAFQWARTYGGMENDRAVELVRTDDGGFAIYGVSASFGSASSAYYIRTDHTGASGCNEHAVIFTETTITTPVTDAPFVTSDHPGTSSTTPNFPPWQLVEVLVCMSTNVEGAEAGLFLLYPNPTSGELNINLPGIRLERVEIVDITGRSVRTVIAPSTTQIDVSGLAAGPYRLRASYEARQWTGTFHVVH
jgi:hypothetical protein